MTSVKNCPFCGHRVSQTAWYLGREPEGMAVYCSDCGAQGPWAATEEEAITRWNARAKE